jgi:RimJ/RimL family protein N-acetyltransferase
MTIRPIRSDELTGFAAITSRDDRDATVRDYLVHMFEIGAMRPAWCFVAEEAKAPGQFLARAAYWALPGTSTPLYVELLEAPWDRADLNAGIRVLEYALLGARRLGATTIGYTLDEPPRAPQWQHAAPLRVELLESVGFVMERETDRFAWRGDTAPVESDRLVYRSLGEAGEEAFLEAIALVSDGTLDREIQADRDAVGPSEAARLLFDQVRKLNHDPGWWQLAYEPGGDLAGLVMPAENPDAATIGYVGVAPRKRGQGFVDDLLARATATLRAVGVGRVVADTDRRNVPMANAFRRAGYAHTGTRREYRADLTSLG